MSLHTLEPTAETVRGSFSRDYPPILEVNAGDRLTARTLDARWNLKPLAAPGVPIDVLEHTEFGHCLCGPILVRDAAPGVILSVSLHSLAPEDWGWSEAGHQDSDINRRLGIEPGAPSSLLWTIDAARGTATDQLNRTVEIRPFLGVIGLAPPEHGVHSTIPPRVWGGNIDCNELVAGSTLYLPVACEGALLSIGDGHAAQGDGELSETAIECGMTTELTLDLHEDELPAPCAITPTARITFAFHRDLDEAMVTAAGAMLSWLEDLLQVDRRTALALASLVVDLRITQVVNEVRGVHARVSHAALANLGYKESQPTVE
jgi:acetamidase/formamidase